MALGVAGFQWQEAKERPEAHCVTGSDGPATRHITCRPTPLTATPPPTKTPVAGASAAVAAAPSVRPSRPSRSAAVLALQAQALSHARFDTAAAAVVNQLASKLPCERVSLGLYLGGRLRIVAISGATDVREEQDAVSGIAAAMAEAIEQRLAIVHPMPSSASPAITLAHQALSNANGQAAVYTVPVATRHELLGALTFERRGGFDNPALEAAKDAAMFAGPLLALKQRADDRMGQRVAQALRPAARRPFGSVPFSLGRAAAALSACALAGAALLPVSHHVVAPARVEGAVQQVIAAPVDGFVGAVAVRPGQSVRAGTVLLSLDTRELALERDKWVAEASQLDKQYREALSRDEAAPIMIARAKLEQAQSQQALAERQLERSTLRAPIDGVVLSGDLSQSLGMPLKRGQELMTIARDGGWRVVAEVEEQDIAALRDGQPAQVLFAAFSGQEALGFTVTRIAPVATQADGRNVFEVEGTPAPNAAGLRPGMRGVARIGVGQRALGAVWWERAQHAARRFAWQVLG
jgi:RND family efflux transporter MFP subunit